MPASAYLLVAHGSRDPRPQQALEILAQQVRQGLEQATPRLATVASGSGNNHSPISIAVGTACLELQPQPLHQQILDFAEQALPGRDSLAIPTLEIVPLFLLPGVHVMDDIPAEVAIAQQHLGDRAILHIRPYLGTSNALPTALDSLIPRPQNGSLILMSHGSRRPNGNVPIEDLAQHLNATVAYWSIPPSLEEQLTAMLQQGCQNITVFPYILFPAGITDAIATTLNDFAQRYPQVHFQALPALSAIAPLAQWIIHGLAES